MPQEQLELYSVEELREKMGLAYNDLAVQVAFKEGYNRSTKDHFQELATERKRAVEETVLEVIDQIEKVGAKGNMDILKYVDFLKNHYLTRGTQ